MSKQLSSLSQFPTHKNPNKIFGLGLSRTGTKSLSLALDMLGYTIAHYPHDSETLKELQAKQANFTLLQYVDGITDITVIPFYPQLDQAFPGSKFILTVRDRQSWLSSLKSHWHFDQYLLDVTNHSEAACRNFAVTQLLKQLVFFTLDFDENHMLSVYEAHYTQVMAYFRDRPDDLLVLNICGGEAWEKLSPFLGHPRPTDPFPFVETDAQLLKNTQNLPNIHQHDIVKLSE